jgi:tryptophanyl-tRNA synthetase
MKKRIFSGVQPSGNIHIGNYLGAIKQWVDLADDFDESIYCIVDLHAITIPQDSKELKKKIMEVAALYIACGVDPKKASIFVQSERPEHSELTWILNCITGLGELSRMTQFKEKTTRGLSESVGIGLLD